MYRPASTHSLFSMQHANIGEKDKWRNFVKVVFVRFCLIEDSQKCLGYIFAIEQNVHELRIYCEAE